MSDRNRWIRIPVIVVLLLLLAAIVLPAQAAPELDGPSRATFWSLIDEVWSSVIGVYSVEGGDDGGDDGESGPIIDPDGYNLSIPPEDPGAETASEGHSSGGAVIDPGA